MVLLLSLLFALAGDPTVPEYPAPGGEYVLRLEPEEVRMSHWLDLPTVLRTADQSVIWSVGYPWSVSSHQWVSSEELDLSLRQYPGNRPPIRIKLLLFAHAYVLWEESTRSWALDERPLSGLNRFLDSL